MSKCSRDGAAGFGVLRNGSNRSRIATRCAIGMIFREQRADEECLGLRSLNVGRKEMLLEFSPGIKPPTYLKMRVIAGPEVKLILIQVVTRAFLAVKREGNFEEDFAEALRSLVKRFVERVSVIDQVVG